MAINVTTEVLRDIDAGLITFASEARETLASHQPDLEHVTTEISTHERRLELGAIRVEQRLREAESALRQCENSGQRDERGNYQAPDCSAYRAEVERWRSLLSQVHDEIRETAALGRRASTAGAAMHDQARRFARELDESVSAQRRFLAGALEDLARLHAIDVPGGGVFAVGERANASRAETEAGRGNPERGG